METFSAQPQESPKHKSKFQIFLLLGLIAILVVVVILDILSFAGKVNFKKEIQRLVGAEDSTGSTPSEKVGTRKWSECKELKEADFFPKTFSSYKNIINGPDTTPEQAKQGFVKENNEARAAFIKEGQILDLSGKTTNSFISIRTSADVKVLKEWEEALSQVGYHQLSFQVEKKEVLGETTLILSVQDSDSTTGLEQDIKIFQTLVKNTHWIEVTFLGSFADKAENIYKDWFNEICS